MPEAISETPWWHFPKLANIHQIESHRRWLHVRNTEMQNMQTPSPNGHSGRKPGFHFRFNKLSLVIVDARIRLQKFKHATYVEVHNGPTSYKDWDGQDQGCGLRFFQVGKWAIYQFSSKNLQRELKKKHCQ